MPDPEQKKDFFISYSGDDKTWAEWIAWQLDEAGYTTVLQAWDFRPGSNFLAWARTIAKYEALQLARDRAKAPTSLSPDVIEQLSTTAPDFDNPDERLGMMRECIETLAPRAKEVIQLRYAKALEPVEIADRMKLAIQSVSVMLSRARASLRKCIERKLKQRGGR